MTISLVSACGWLVLAASGFALSAKADRSRNELRLGGGFFLLLFSIAVASFLLDR